MSSYSNFIEDFPSRCLDILETYEKQSRTRNREVTLMLALATAGFLIPFERLRPPSENLNHPSGDRERFQEAKDGFEKILDAPFLGSELWKQDVGSWIFAKEVKDVQKDPDFWVELENPKPLSAEKKVKSISKHLRNALAHGNIYTRGEPIQILIFLSRCMDGAGNPTDKYAMLAASPQDFRKLLINWVNFLSSLPIPTAIMQGATLELLEYGT